VSWNATQYVWTLSRQVDGREAIKGSVKLVLLAVAAIVPDRHMQTGLLRLGTLVAMTGLEERQVRRCRDLLARLREIDVEVDGKRARYGMVGMVGPLFAFGAADADKMSGFLRVIERWESGQDVRIRLNLDKLSGFVKQPSPFSEDVRTQDHHYKNTPIRKVVDAHRFIDWWNATAPLHPHGGPISTSDAEACGLKLQRLLKHRSFERLQSLAPVLWSVTSAESGWLFDTDRSLHVFTAKIDALDRIAALRELTTQGADARGHVPPCRSTTECNRKFEAEIAARREAVS
jgi:hypothetical protein